MNTKIKKENGWILKWIIIFIAIILLLSYFNFNIKSFIQSAPVQDNFTYIWSDNLKPIWDTFSVYVKPLFGPISERFKNSSDLFNTLKNFNTLPGIPQIPR